MLEQFNSCFYFQMPGLANKALNRRGEDGAGFGNKTRNAQVAPLAVTFRFCCPTTASAALSRFFPLTRSVCSRERALLWQRGCTNKRSYLCSLLK